MGHIKNVSFPLPMGTMGGCSTNLAFQVLNTSDVVISSLFIFVCVNRVAYWTFDSGASSAAPRRFEPPCID
jgi:hypothetical protein